MDLPQILDRFVEGLTHLDGETIEPSRKRESPFLPGIKTVTETDFVRALCEWWGTAYPGDFNPRGSIATEVRYPSGQRKRCDLALTTDGDGSAAEWWLEVKHIALVGNNGNKNDYGVGKLLSPYYKDHALIQDINRLGTFGLGRRRAVIGYCFGYSFASCDEALRRHPEHHEFIGNLRDVCRSNDAREGQLSALPMVEFADSIFRARDLVNPVEVREFRDAWRHPCGGNGHVWGWELKIAEAAN